MEVTHASIERIYLWTNSNNNILYWSEREFVLKCCLLYIFNVLWAISPEYILQYDEPKKIRAVTQNTKMVQLAICSKNNNNLNRFILNKISSHF